MPRLPGYGDNQLRNAAVIITVGQEMKVPPRGWVVAVATAMQESRLLNLANRTVAQSRRIPNQGVGADHDSVGLFQQRASWGTVEQRMTPEYAARKFYEKLVQVPGWQTMPLTRAAQRVQISAFPDAYAKHEDLAARIVDALAGVPPAPPSLVTGTSATPPQAERSPRPLDRPDTRRSRLGLPHGQPARSQRCRHRRAQGHPDPGHHRRSGAGLPL